MTPMIDIVFLLIIFFMTVSQVSKTNKENVELPELQGSEDQQPTTLTVNVMQAGELIVSGTPVSLTELKLLASRELGNVGNQPERLQVVLRADQRGTSQAVNEVVTALSQMQIKRVRIAVQVPE